MDHLVRTATAEAIRRDARTVERLRDSPLSAAALADRLDAAVYVELLRPAAADGVVAVPGDHYDAVVDDLHDYRAKREASEGGWSGLTDVGTGRLYRRGYGAVGAIPSTDVAAARLTGLRRRETKLLTGLVTSSIALGTALVLAGGALDVAWLLGVGLAVLAGMIPLSIGAWGYYRGAKDRALEERYRDEAASLADGFGTREVRVENG